MYLACIRFTKNSITNNAKICNARAKVQSAEQVLMSSLSKYTGDQCEGWGAGWKSSCFPPCHKHGLSLLSDWYSPRCFPPLWVEDQVRKDLVNGIFGYFGKLEGKLWEEKQQFLLLCIFPLWYSGSRIQVNRCFCRMFKGLKASVRRCCRDIQLLSQDFRSSVFILILCSKFAHWSSCTIHELRSFLMGLQSCPAVPGPSVPVMHRLSN